MNADNWKEIIFILIGAGVGFLISILTVIVNRLLDKAGKVSIFYKVVAEPALNYPSGISEQNNIITILIPIYFDFQNTTNSPVILRDVCLYLFHKGKEVRKLIQLTDISERKELNGNTTETVIHKKGGEKSEYSFVIPPLSISRQICTFYEVAPSNIDEKLPIDEIRLAYYDSNNKRVEAKMIQLPDGWKNMSFDNNKDFTLLKCKKIKRRKK